jgi:hypothetical protein
MHVNTPEIVCALFRFLSIGKKIPETQFLFGSRAGYDKLYKIVGIKA